MAEVNPNGAFHEEWWNNTFLPTLRAWRATRPRGSAFLTNRAQDRFAGLTETWQLNIAPNLASDIADLEWHLVAPFATLVAEVKGVASPVFASKFCHFLAPRIFPVVDNKAMRNPFPTSYERFYKFGRAEWLATAHGTQEELLQRLTAEIDDRVVDGQEIVAGYPKKCKLIELCIIGRRNNA
jgi:hypothetical protein